MRHIHVPEIYSGRHEKFVVARVDVDQLDFDGFSGSEFMLHSKHCVVFLETIGDWHKV
jgi:hypothetical protein